MKLYAGAIQAQKLYLRRSVVRACPVYLFADNEDEATGRALGAARKEFPEEDGWFNHSASVMEIKEKTVRDWLNTISSPDIA